MPVPTPLLRSPDFAWVRPEMAAVSVPVCATPGKLPWDEERFERLLDTIRTARVGGSFWAPPAAFHPAVVLRPRGIGDATAMAEGALARAEAGSVLAVLSPGGAMSASRIALAARGIAVTSVPVDPWSVLTTDVALYAHPDDEYVQLATIAGSEIIAGDQASERQARLRHALLDAVIYRDPFRRRIVEPEEAVALLAEWRGIAEANRRIAAVSGIAWWKRRAVGRLLWSGHERPIRFARRSVAAIRIARPVGGAVAAWPSRMSADLPRRARAENVPLMRIEDGFLRSAGLGAGLHPPCSIVADAVGVHYDPAGPSALEQLLETADFPAEILARAQRLIGDIVRARVGKYGIDQVPCPWPRRGSHRRVLVIGQVEDDQSVRLGGAGVTGNHKLLRLVRTAEPDSELWFRPHPDVEAGHRRGAVADSAALHFANRIVRGGSPVDLFERVDAVHVLTSQTGFEALLHGLPVTTHGHPFFAGWGLTTDLAGQLPRRTRRLTLVQLVAGALILYPRYLDPDTQLPCPVEVLVERLARPAPAPGWLIRARGWQGRLRRSLAVGTA